MFNILFLIACGGPQETYIIPTGTQPRNLNPNPTETIDPTELNEDEVNIGDNNIAPTVQEGETVGNLPVGIDEGCGPTSQWAQKIEMDDENSITLTGELLGATNPEGTFLLDLIAADGTQLYSLMCKQVALELQIPIENGSRLIVFEDSNNNGPSKEDKQGEYTLPTPITGPIVDIEITLGDKSVLGFNFSGKEQPENDLPPSPSDEANIGLNDTESPEMENSEDLPLMIQDIPPGDEDAINTIPNDDPPPPPVEGQE